MSAVLSAPNTLDDAHQHSEGVWHAAWRRFRADRVGLASLVVVLAFLVLIAASALGLVAKDWQKEVGVPNAPPGFVGLLLFGRPENRRRGEGFGDFALPVGCDESRLREQHQDQERGDDPQGHEADLVLPQPLPCLRPHPRRPG